MQPSNDRKKRLQTNTSSLLNRNQILKNFAIGFVPIFVFIFADAFFGTEIGLMVAVAAGSVYFIYHLIRFRRIEKMILLDTLLIIVLGGISITLHDDLFFKLKPALIEMILVVILGIHAFSSRPILINMSRRFLGDAKLPPEQVRLMKQLSRMLFVVIAVHTLLIVFSAFFWSKEVWAFISGGLFYIILGIIIVGQYLYFKWIRKPSPTNRCSSENTEEMFDIVNEEGRIIGKATRSRAHSAPSLLHPTVAMHIISRNGRLYLQKRAANKYLYPGYWDTAVAGHVRSGESLQQALAREAMEELNIQVESLKPIFRYIISHGNERELVYVFVLKHDGPFKLNPEEIETGRFWSLFEIRRMMQDNIFTPGFIREFKALQENSII